MGDYAKELVRGVLFGVIKNLGINVPIHPGYMSDVLNPIYPCITLNKRGSTRPDTIADDNTLYLSVWSKVGNNELWDIYNQVKPILNLKGIQGNEATNYHSILWMIETYTNDALFEKYTFTHQLATRYHMDML